MEKAKSGVALAGLSIILGYTVYKYGGVLPRDWAVTVLAVGVLGVVFWGLRNRQGAPALERVIWLPMVLFPAYLLFQCVPLPDFVIRVLSPARAEIARGLAPVFQAPLAYPLTVSPPATFAILGRILAYTVIFFVVREALWQFADRPWLVAAGLVVVGAGEALYGFVQFRLHPGAEYAQGNYINRNHFSNLLELTLPFAVMYVVAAAQQLRRGTNKSRWTSVVMCGAGIAVLAMMAGILASLSRSGFVAMAFAWMVVLFFLSRQFLSGRSLVTKWVIAGAIITCLALLPSNRLLLRFGQIFGSSGVDTGLRVEAWTGTLSMIRDYPFFGCGAGAYEHAFQKFAQGFFFLKPDFAHNDLLQASAELGVVGIAILLAFGAAIVSTALRFASDDVRSEYRPLAIACMASLTAAFVHAFSEFNLYIPANAFALTWIVAIVAGLRPLRVRRPGYSTQGNTSEPFLVVVR